MSRRAGVAGWRLLLGMMLVVAGAGGCAVRGPGSAGVPAPFDPEREVNEANAASLLRSPSLHFAQPQEYTIGPGDVMALTLVGRPDILDENRNAGEKFRITVTDSPLITLPLIGVIKVHGKTPLQLEEELRVAYSAYIQNPVPILTLEKMHYHQVTVLGAVATPGRFPLEVGDTLMDAIFRAGGLTSGGRTAGPPPARYLKLYREKNTRRDRAEMTPEQLLARLQKDGVMVPREEIVVPIEDFIFSGNLDYNIPVQPNDIVYVPPAGAVIVQGHVHSPGVVFLGPSVRMLSHSLTERRGLRWGAAARVEVVRTLPGGEQVSFFLNGRRIINRRDPDFLLQDNDQVFVFAHPVRAPLEWIGNIFRAGVSAGASATYNPLG